MTSISAVSGNGNLSHSMRANYAQYGVSEYYTKVGKTYRNPHFPGVKACIFEWMNRWWLNERQERERPPVPKHNTNSESITVFDMACGSGEATICILQWYEQGIAAQKQREPKCGYENDQPIRASGSTIPSSPKRLPVVRPVKLQDRKSQQVKKVEIGVSAPRPVILAADPFTSDAFMERTNMTCASLSFREISEGAIPRVSRLLKEASEKAIFQEQLFRHHQEEEEKKEEQRQEVVQQERGRNSIQKGVDHFQQELQQEQILADTDINIDIVICSFALHLIESPSELFSLLWELSTKVKWLVVLAPHKKPEIKEGWGWTKWDTENWRQCLMNESVGEILKERTHCRVYRSLNVE